MFCGVVDADRTAAVLLYDLRSTAGAVGKFRAAAQQRQAVHSICHTTEDEIICATMGGVWAWGGGTKGGGSGGGDESAAEQLQIQVKREGAGTFWAWGRGGGSSLLLFWRYFSDPTARRTIGSTVVIDLFGIYPFGPFFLFSAHSAFFFP